MGVAFLESNTVQVTALSLGCLSATWRPGVIRVVSQACHRWAGGWEHVYGETDANEAPGVRVLW